MHFTHFTTNKMIVDEVAEVHKKRIAEILKDMSSSRDFFSIKHVAVSNRETIIFFRRKNKSGGSDFCYVKVLSTDSPLEEVLQNLTA